MALTPGTRLGVYEVTEQNGEGRPVDSEPEVLDRPKIREAEFYEPFAEWLVKELEECTKAVPFGGCAFKDKWGTPDVVGIREPRKSDIIKFPTRSCQPR